MRSAIPELESPRRGTRAEAPRMTLAARNQSENGGGGATFEAGAHTRRTTGWRAPTVSPNAAVLANLTTLRDRSRAAKRNDGYAHGAIEGLVCEIIGTGIKPMSLAKDAGFREELQAVWLAFTDECDADGQHDFYGLQAQAVRGWKEGGETFTRMRPRLKSDGLTVPLQLQVLEPELVPLTHNDYTRRIRAGIEFNGIGQRVAYHFHPSRPELDDWDMSRLVRLPADNVCHLYDPLRPGQLRGLPILTPSLITFNELDKTDDAVLLRTQLSNMHAWFIQRPGVAGENSALNPLTGQAVERDDEDRPLVSMEPGITQELDPGETFTFSEPPDPPSTLPDFMRYQMMRAAAGARIPYEFISGDMSRINDRTVRVILQTFRRQLRMWQHQRVVYQFCRRVWDAFMYRVFISGVLSIPVEFLDDPTPWAAVKWVPEGWPYIHPLQDVEADTKSVQAGFTSRKAVVSARGEDAEAIDLENADDNKRADEKGLKYTSDGRTAAAAKSEPATSTEGEPAEREDETRERESQGAAA